MTPSFELMAPLMFAGLIVVLLIGYPVAFSLSAVGLGFGFLAIQLGYFDFVLLQALPERIFGIASNQLLLSIPFFTFMSGEPTTRTAPWRHFLWKRVHFLWQPGSCPLPVFVV